MSSKPVRVLRRQEVPNATAHGMADGAAAQPARANANGSPSTPTPTVPLSMVRRVLVVEAMVWRRWWSSSALTAVSTMW